MHMVGCVEQQTSHTVEVKTFDFMTRAFFKAVCMSHRKVKKDFANDLDLRKVKQSRSQKSQTEQGWLAAPPRHADCSRSPVTQRRQLNARVSVSSVEQSSSWWQKFAAQLKLKASAVTAPSLL